MNPIQFKKISKEMFYKNLDVMSQYHFRKTMEHYCDYSDFLTQAEKNELCQSFKIYADFLKALENITFKYKPIGKANDH